MHMHRTNKFAERKANNHFDRFLWFCDYLYHRLDLDLDLSLSSLLVISEEKQNNSIMPTQAKRKRDLSATPSANPSATPQLTPASSIPESEFVSLFDHRQVTRYETFVSLIKGRRPTRENVTPGIPDTLTNRALYRFALLGNEKKLQQFITGELEKITDLSTTALLKKGVSEASMKNTFVRYAAEMKKKLPQTGWKDYPHDPRGCLITKTSRQDTACLNTKTLRIFHGEFKHSFEYSIQDGIRQCAGYLWHQLWWFRTVQGLGVEQVFGFVISGPKCKDTHGNKKMTSKVAVSLLILSQCTEIGGKFELYEYRKMYDADVLSTATLSAFDELNVFLKTGFENTPVQAKRIHSDRICPGIMMMPQDLILDETVNHSWTIIPSGTAALVVRIDAKSDVESGEALARDFLGKLSFKRESIKNEFKKSLGLIVEEEKTFYLKIKTFASGITWSQKVLGDADNKIQDIVNPYIEEWRRIYSSRKSFACKGGIAFLMRDAGVTLDHVANNQLSYDVFCRQFLSFMKGTLLIQEYSGLVHGDIHAKNLLFQPKRTAEDEDDLLRLRLIDWDESWDKPLKRIVRTQIQKERYPEELLLYEEAYTKVQLILLFRDVSEDFFSRHIYEVSGKLSIRENPDQSFKQLSMVLPKDSFETFVNERYDWLEDALLESQDDSQALKQEIERLAVLHFDESKLSSFVRGW